MSSTGITTYIHKTLCKGIPFTRNVRNKKAKKSQTALSVGRRVDAMLKNYAKKKDLPSDKTDAGKICLNAIRSLKKSGIILNDANKFLKLGNIRTHVDGIGRRGNLKVIVELKTTTRKLKDAEDVYNLPCIKLAKIQGFANTEAFHHQLQLGWTTRAYRATVCAYNVVGVIVLSAIDGAKLIRLDETFASAAFWDRTIAAYPVLKPHGKPSFTGVQLWPGELADKAVEKVTGALPETLINSRVRIFKCGGGAIATTKPRKMWTKSFLQKTQKTILGTGASRAWIIFRGMKGWQVLPITAIKPSSI